MDKVIKGMILGLVFGLIIGIVAGSILYNSISRNFFNRSNLENFQIDELTKDSIFSFFQSTTDIDEIIDYCSQNRMNCAYYCKDVNPEHEICSQIKFDSLGFRNKS